MLLSSGAVVGDDLPGHTVIGCNNVIGHHAVVGIKCQDLKYKVSFKFVLIVRSINFNYMIVLIYVGSQYMLLAITW